MTRRFDPTSIWSAIIIGAIGAILGFAVNAVLGPIIVGAFFPPLLSDQPLPPPESSVWTTRALAVGALYLGLPLIGGVLGAMFGGREAGRAKIALGALIAVAVVWGCAATFIFLSFLR